MANTSAGILGDGATQAAVLAQRRCIILAIVGATPTSNSALESILQAGFLSAVKTWLDDILNGTVGGVDLLLHLLTNITQLPVTKTVVKDSGMGKAIGSVEKHSICVGSPNEQAIKDRVKQIKGAWNKSVKALKEKSPVAEKRELEESSSGSPIAKKARLEDTKKSSFSSLLKKMAPDSKEALAQDTSPKAATVAVPDSSKGTAEKVGEQSKKEKKLKRVKWQDHFGGELTAARTIEGNEPAADESSVSWSDKRRRDRLREKELLAKVKKSKLLMDDDGGDLGMDITTKPSPAVPPTTAWRTPALLPERADAPPPQVNSQEAASQTARMTNIPQVRYSSEYNVPASPTPMSDVEQALDMTAQSSTVTQSIPFFVPQQVPEPPAPAPAPVATSYSQHGALTNGWGASQQHAPIGHVANTNSATPEYVQSLGLPMFLVGQDVQALQTLANNPSLLSTFVDSNGMYDQARLTSLVQTLSQSPQQQQQPIGQVGAGGFSHNSTFGRDQAYPSSVPAGGGIYGPASGGTYGPASGGFANGWQGSNTKSAYRGEQNNGEGNLHVSGYGPTTTQTDIINLFAPYVQVDEVVMKGTFSFVNTSDTVGAKRAREALSGALLGGAPIRINLAQRKKREDMPPMDNGSQAGSFYGNSTPAISNFPPSVPMNPVGYPPAVGVPPPAQMGGADVSNVRDDRGNPATKNLFVAGYGQGTSEHQLRELFGQHARIIGIIMKGTFSFINTSDRASAVHAREVLSGTMLNGGVLRINFAKESGRLGTSFDVTYNSGSGRSGGGGGSHSHYGRGF